MYIDHTHTWCTEGHTYPACFNVLKAHRNMCTLLYFIQSNHFGYPRCSQSTSGGPLSCLVSHTPERYTRKPLKYYQTVAQGTWPTCGDLIYVGMATNIYVSREICLRYAELEARLGEIDRARAIYSHGSQISDPRVSYKWVTTSCYHCRGDQSG